MRPAPILIALAACGREPEPKPPGTSYEPFDYTTVDTGTEAPVAGLDWMVSGGGPLADWCAGAAVAGDGAVVTACDVTGFTSWQPGDLRLDTVGRSDVVVVGADSDDGSIRWTVHVGSDGPDQVVSAPVTLPDGRVAVSVSIGGPVTTADLPVSGSIAGDLLLLLVGGGGPSQAVRVANGDFAMMSGNEVVSAFGKIAPTPAGGLLVSCVPGGGGVTLMPGSADEQVLSGIGGSAPETLGLALDADLRLERVWRFGTLDSSFVARLLPETDGGVTLGGTFTGMATLGVIDPVSFVAADPTLGDALVARLDSAGEVLWSLQLGSDGVDADDWLRDLAHGPDGGWFATGHWGLGEGGVPLVVTGLPPMDGAPDLDCYSPDYGWDGFCATDGFVLSIASDGTPRWVQGIASSYVDLPVSVFPLGDGGVWVMGETSGGPTTSDGAPIGASGGASAVRLDEAGAAVSWLEHADGWGHGGGVLDDGDVVLTGWTGWEASGFVARFTP